jgi:hypothetical protein
MSDMKRRTQNRDAQRRFREKKDKQMKLSKQQFEQLTSRYEALLAENASLKDQRLAREDCSLQVTDEDFLHPTSVEWEFDPLPPSHAGKFTDQLDGTLFGLEAQDVRLRTPRVSEVVEDPASALDMECATFSFDELQDTIIPTVEHPPSNVIESAVAVAQELSYPGAETSSACVFNSSTFPDAASGLGYGPCSASSFSPALPFYGAGFADTFSTCIPKTDLVQALLHVASVQERIAFMNLEQAKLRVCAC